MTESDAYSLEDSHGGMIERKMIEGIRTTPLLRLDLHPLGSIDQRIIAVLHPFLRHWRVRSGGAFRLTAIMASSVKSYAEYDTSLSRADGALGTTRGPCVSSPRERSRWSPHSGPEASTRHDEAETDP